MDRPLRVPRRNPDDVQAQKRRKHRALRLPQRRLILQKPDLMLHRPQKRKKRRNRGRSRRNLNPKRSKFRQEIREPIRLQIHV